MAINFKPMKKSELRHYLAAYRSLFEGWEERGVCFFRVSGPFLQQVWFEALRSGAYRPVMDLSLLIAPGGSVIHQFLGIKNREVLPRDHDRRYMGVCNAIVEEFRPEVTMLLDESEAVQLFVAKSVRRILDASSLAALYAYLGDSSKAREMIQEVRQLASSKVELFDWEHDRVSETELLAAEIETGNQASYLAMIRENELARFLGSPA